MKNILLLSLTLCAFFFGRAQAPVAYWHFDYDPSYFIINDNEGTYDLERHLGGGTTPEIGTGTPIVGNYWTFSDGNSYYFNNDFVSVGDKRTIEFLFRPDEMIEPLRFFFSGLTLSIEHSSIVATVRTEDDEGVKDSSFVFNYDGYGRKTYDYLVDGNWHHFAVTADLTTRAIQLYIDGLSPYESVGYLDPPVGSETFYTPGSIDMLLGASDDNLEFSGDIDEIAVYTEVLSATMIEQHYEDVTMGNHYSTIDPGGFVTVPLPPVDLHVHEYAPGTDALQQMSKYRVARYYPGHNLMPNTSWLQNNLMMGDPGDDSDLDYILRTRDLNLQLAHNFNYYLTVDNIGRRSYFYAGDTDGDPAPTLHPYNEMLVDLANDYTEYPLFVRTHWSRIQTNITAGDPLYGFDVGPHAHCERTAGDLEAYYTMGTEVYLKDLADDYILDGDGYKRISSSGIYEELSGFDGKGVYFQQINPILHHIERPIDFVVDNNEAINPLLGGPGDYATWAPMDPDCNAEIIGLFGGDVDNYLGTFKGNLNDAFFDAIKAEMTTSPYGTATNYSAYHVCSRAGVGFKYEQARTGLPKINDRYYSTPAFYPVTPTDWKFQSGPYATMKTLMEGREVEIALGDDHFSPFVSPGWSTTSDKNIRPGQYLGILKLLGAAGAEFYHAFHVIGDEGSEAPEDFVWNAVMPSYAQAITSRYEDFLRNGELLPGHGITHSGGDGYYQNLPYDYVSNGGDPDKPMDPNMITYIRKLDGAEKYLITTTIQRQYNVAGNAPAQKENTIMFGSQPLKFYSRRQGSVYIYDRTNPADPIFYQLDKWHEHTHPFYWSVSMGYEAEVYDNNSTIDFDLHTEGIVDPGGGAPIDFTNHRTYIEFHNNHSSFGAAAITLALNEAADYYFHPRTLPFYDQYGVQITLKSDPTVSPGQNKVMVFLDNVYLGDLDAGDDTWHTATYILPTLAVDNFSEYKLSIVPKSKKILIDRFDVTPVLLLTAKPADEAGILLDWDNLPTDEGFWLERSIDGVNFERLTYISNGKVVSSYLDTDAEKDVQYYYQAVFDFDQDNDEVEPTYQRFSNVAFAKTGTDNNDLFILPNPANDFTVVRMSAEIDEAVNLIIYSADGRLVHNEQVTLTKGTNELELNTSGFERGIYLVHVKYESHTVTKQLVIN